MGEFISNNLNLNLEQAKKFTKKKYFIINGTTLRGLMINHKINPKEFLEYVHNINFDIIKPDKKLNNLLNKITWKKDCIYKC